MAFLHYKETNSKYIPCKLKRKTRITFMYLHIATYYNKKLAYK